jgi:hypothetical protein
MWCSRQNFASLPGETPFFASHGVTTRAIRKGYQKQASPSNSTTLIPPSLTVSITKFIHVYMRTTELLVASIPPVMMREVERLKKAEHRTRSELVREALRTYFALVARCPEEKPTAADIRALREGTARIRPRRNGTTRESPS